MRNRSEAVTRNQTQPKLRPAWATGNDHPFMHKAIRVLKYPELDPRFLSPKSNLDVEWQCDCGQRVIRSLSETAKRKDAKCATCLNTVTSLFEYEVQAHLQANLPKLEVLLHQRKDSYRKFIDLYLPALDLAVELDPYRTHFTAHERDVRVLAELVEHYKHALRMRDERLPEISGSITTPKSEPKNARVWASLILEHPLLCSHVRPASSFAVDQALATANDLWAARSAKPQNPLDESAGATEAFVKNLTRPGRRPDYTPQGANDDALWKCLIEGCDHEYKQRIYRWVQGIRCPKHKGASIRRGRRSGVGNANLRENYPELYSELLGVVDRPETKPEEVSGWDPEICEWRCPDYKHLYRMAPISRMVHGSGCTICLKLTGTARMPEPIDRLNTTHPELAKQFVRNITHPLRTLNGLRARSTDICEWSCPLDSTHPTWECMVSQRTAAANRGSCKSCKQATR